MWFKTLPTVFLLVVVKNVTCRMFFLTRREDVIPQNNIVRVDSGYSNTHYVSKENPVKTIVYPNHWEIQRPRPFTVPKANYETNLEPTILRNYKNEQPAANIIKHPVKVNEHFSNSDWIPTKTPVYHQQQPVVPNYQPPVVYDEGLQEQNKYFAFSPQNVMYLPTGNHVPFPQQFYHPIPNLVSVIKPDYNEQVIPAMYKVLGMPQQPQQVFHSPNNYEEESLSKNPIIVQDVPQFSNNFAPSTSVEVIRSISYQLPTQIGTGLLHMGGNNIYLKPVSEKVYIKPLPAWQNGQFSHTPMLIYKGFQGPQGNGDQLPSHSTQYNRFNRLPIMFDASNENKSEEKTGNVKDEDRKVFKKDLTKFNTAMADGNQIVAASQGGDLKLQRNNSSFVNLENPPTMKPKFVQKQKRHIYGERIHIFD